MQIVLGEEIFDEFEPKSFFTFFAIGENHSFMVLFMILKFKMHNLST